MELYTLAAIDAEIARRAGRKLTRFYPDAGPLRRELYPRHLECFAAGATHRERLFLAANRVGKTEGVGAYELAVHLTGRYPEWWQGRRWNRPVMAWAAGDTAKTVRDILQTKLLGATGAQGTGMIPADSIRRVTARAGVADAVDTVDVLHASGGHSHLVFKSYDQRRESFQGTEQDFVWLDEEPPEDVYAECLIRTMTNDGLLLLTFTPLTGMSRVVSAFLESPSASKFTVTATWDDVPHLGEDAKAEMLAAMPEFQRDARSKGVPALGSGAIYPLAQDRYVVDDFPLPAHWPRAFGLDVGWNTTAAIFGALDRDSGTLYVYSEHYAGKMEPALHAEAIKARGAWIPGVIDPAAMGRSQVDGRQVMNLYKQNGLKLAPADNSVEAGIHDVWQALSSGRLKVFRSCRSLLGEMALYRRDEDGKVVKERDHACDAMRYLWRSGRAIAKVEEEPKPVIEMGRYAAANWMA